MEHSKEHMEIKMEIKRTFKDALTRQADEAVRICNSSKNNKIGSLNFKSQFNNPRISRKTASTGVAIFRNTPAPVT